MTPTTTDAFGGTDRFTIVRRIGAGGMGVVYEAFDREREMPVALKTLPRFEPSALYQFKGEFRSLADIAHANLIALYELIADGDRWFFTMELVDGVSFLKYVRPEQIFPAAPESPTRSHSPGALLEERHTGDQGARHVLQSSRVSAESMPLSFELPPVLERDLLDLERLRHTLPQVAQGVAAVHEAGKLHRDLKPSNVLVTREGRVVILDFGLVRELELRASDRPAPRDLSGTIDYMSPEQAAGQALTAASDWYSVGVMLYEALTGRRPFHGSVLEVLRDKQTRSPDPPQALRPSTPADLDEICMALLERRPEKRPSGADVVNLVRGAGQVGGQPRATPAGTRRTQTLVGRERHRAVLNDAFASVLRGRPESVLVHGAAGMGKSALVKEFLDEIASYPDVVLVSGRCYENESVPYKAFDSVIDRLGQYLAEMDDSSAAAWLPPDAGLLAQLFPVLKQVDGIARAARDVNPATSPQELRRRGFAALRALLTRIGETRRLVLHIDDLHWGDLDSAVLLSHLLRPPAPPVMFFVSAYRSGAHVNSPCVRALLNEELPGGTTLLELERLSMADALRLANELMEDTLDSTAARDAETIARESGGNPYFIGELVARRHGAGAVVSGGEQVTLERVLCAGIDELPDPARQLLEVVAVSGQPIHQSDAFSAARLSAKDPGALVLLRKKNLVRTTGTSDQLLVDTYHDRVREALLASLNPDIIKRHHYHLAHTLEASRRAEPETLGRHLDAAGESDKARQFYAAGGDAAARTLTFDHAARLYRRATELGSPDPAELRALRVKLAGALANAGHCREAAVAYEAAAVDAGPGEAIDLLRRAGYHYSIGGYADEGRAVFDDLFRRLHMRLPATPRQAVRRMVWDLAQLKVRGLGFRERRPDTIAPAELSRIDLVWAAATGLMEFDLITGAGLHTRGLLLSLRSGEPYRIARVLAVAAMSGTSVGTPAKARIQQLLTRARSLAHKVDHPHARALVAIAEGIAYWLVDRRWDAARRAFGEANDLLRNQAPGMTWEMNLLHSHRVWMHYFQGHFAEGVNYSTEVIREARDRGDAYLQVNLGTFAGGYGRLMADDPDGARSSIEHVAAQLPQRVTNIQRVHQMMVRCHIDLYCADPAAWTGLTANWPLLVETYQLRSEQMRIQMYHLRARSALCALSAASDPKPLVTEAESVARRLEREHPPWAHAEAQLIRAGLAVWRGDRAVAADLLDAAARTFEAFGCGQFSTPALRWQGKLIGGDRGRELVAAADEALAGQGIRNPERWSRTWVTIPEPRP